MKNPLPRINTFVKKHDKLIAATAGFSAGILVVYYYIDSKTLLEITAENVQHMRDNKVGILYETELGDLILTVIPTIE